MTIPKDNPGEPCGRRPENGKLGRARERKNEVELKERTTGHTSSWLFSKSRRFSGGGGIGNG